MATEFRYPSDPTRPKPDWARYIREQGKQIRVARQFLGLSQDQLARLADVSQGAVSRVEAGRGMATPLLTFVKLRRVVRQALRELAPDKLSDEARALLDATEPMEPSSISESAAEPEQAPAPILRDRELYDFISEYWKLPERERNGVLMVAKATIQTLSRHPSDPGEPPRQHAEGPRGS